MTTPNPNFGIKQGTEIKVRHPVAASQTIYHNDPVTKGTGGVARAAAGEKVYGFAMHAVTSGSTAGVSYLDVNISRECLYRMKTDGTITYANHAFTKGDFGGYAADGTPQIDANDATNADLRIVEIDVTLQTVLVQLAPAPADVP